MAKKNLLLDRYYLIGESKSRRKRQQNSVLGPQFAGHPSLKLSYAQYGNVNSDYGDFFRGAGARYWGFRKGAYKSSWRDFGYIRRASGDEPGAAPSRLHNFVGFKIDEVESTIYQAPQILDSAFNTGQVYLYFGYPPCCYDQTNITGEVAGAYRKPPDQPNPGYTADP